MRGKITFKIGTGTEVIAISKETWENLHTILGEPDLQLPNKLLQGPTRKPLKLQVTSFATLLTKTGNNTNRYMW